MSRVIVFVLIYFFTSLSFYAQWIVQNPSVQYDGLSSVYFLSKYTGWAAGGTSIIKTTDGGNTWINQTSASPEFLRAICFADSNNGTAVGYMGTILTTTNSGNTWEFKSTGVFDQLLTGVTFSDKNNGIIISDIGIMYRSIDGGKSWLEHSYRANNRLYGISFYNSKIGMAVGNSGAMIKTT
ncbi:MAG: YCF48-related protein, partial [Bacteroidota bacterium]|nr:YCF48-related protein [Bacteroidota bacterium]